MRNLCNALVLFTISIAFLLTCTAPSNPFEDRNNVKATLTVLTTESGWIVDSTVNFKLKVDLLDFVDSVQVFFGDGTHLTVGSGEISADWTKEIFHVYTAPGNDSVYTILYENNATHIQTHQTVVNVKTYVLCRWMACSD